jgi:1-acyl-sn-glycerol-3-phosphate acyltransferase
LTSILECAHVIPLDRNGSRDQPLFQRFFELLQKGNWCHIYIEGRVWQNWRFKPNEVHLGPIKSGVGKLIAHAYPNDPVVLPMYHKGMDQLLPEKILGNADQERGLPADTVMKFPSSGNDIHLYVGKPLTFHEKIQRFDEQHPGLLKKSWFSTPETTSLYREIARDIEIELIALEYEAYGRTKPADPFFLSKRSNIHNESK